MNTVKCGECGTALPDEDPSGKPADRKPCPSCGSLTRSFSVQVTGSVAVGISATAAVVQIPDIEKVVSLLMQTVIVAGAKTREGVLIKSVTIPWFEIIRLLEKDPSIAYKISAQKWEEIIAGAYQLAGFDEVTLTPRSGDLGRDVIAIMKGIGSIRVIDQVKAYKPSHLVTANDIRALVGVLHGDGASKGFLTTTSDFAPLVRTDPLIVPFIPSRLELVNGSQLITRLEELAKKQVK